MTIEPADHTPTDHTPTDHTPADHTPTDHTPTDHTPTDHTPTDHTPTDHTPADYAPVDYTPADYTPVDYAAPLDRLLTYGNCQELQKKRQKSDYVAELGLTSEHIPELVRMATDFDLNSADSESLEVWAPVHAWRALGQLRAEAAIEPLIDLFIDYKDDEWFGSEIPGVFGQIGPAAIPALKAHLAEPAHSESSRTIAADALTKIGQQHPESRSTCVEILTQALEQFRHNSRSFNGFILAYLLDLMAVEAARTIERAFAAGRIDPTIAGDWGDVQVDLGLKKRNELPESFTSMQDMVEYYNTTSTPRKMEPPRGFAASSQKPKAHKKKPK